MKAVNKTDKVKKDKPDPVLSVSAKHRREGKLPNRAWSLWQTALKS